jgi:Ca2+:H+ antiporter
MPWWAWTWPLAALVMFGTSVFVGLPDPLTMAAGVALIAAVFAAVYHAEIIAHRVGEPYGTLTLALAVTVIETALIVSLMLAAPGDKSDLARDTVFAAVMIICNGVVGLCLLFGGIRHREQGFQLESALAALAVLAALTVLTLVVPNLTTSTPGPVFATSQLAFAACASLVLYGSFLFFQTVSHREYFLLPDGCDEHVHAAPPSSSQTLLSLFVLIATLVAIVGLAKALSPTLETWVARIGAPKAVVGILVAALVLMPESLAAVRAPRANRLQTSMNFGARLRAGNDRSDHPGGCDPFNRSRPAPDAWPRCQGGRTPRAHAPGCGHHVRDRAYDGAPGRRAPGYLRGFSVLGSGALNVGAPQVHALVRLSRVGSTKDDGEAAQNFRSTK